MHEKDLELLKVAAKAADYDQVRFGTDDIFWVLGEENDWVVWNPIRDDGDALRLAVKLGITLHIDGNFVGAESRMGFSIEAHFDDPYIATRRAIVRAAAEIGKGMS